MKVILSSATKIKLGASFYSRKYAAMLCTTLEEMGHSQNDSN
jgi:hypothetical protein